MSKTDLDQISRVRWATRDFCLVDGLPEYRFIPPAAIKPMAQTVYKATQALREALLDAVGELEPPYTTRNAYYVLISTSDYPKSKKTYDKVKNQLVAMRREGLIHPDDIVDTSRRVIQQRTDLSVGGILDAAASQYNPDIWHDQPQLVQLWTEKDAVSGLLQPLIQKYQVPLYVAKGFASESFTYAAAMAIKASGKPTTLIYCGDHDPSGFYMPAVLMEALHRHLGAYADLVSYQRVAVLPSQAFGELAKFGHPPNKQDPRLDRFTAYFGDGEAVELDAIKPQALRAMVAKVLEEFLPEGWHEDYQAREAEGKRILRDIAKQAKF